MFHINQLQSLLPMSNCSPAVLPTPTYEIIHLLRYMLHLLYTNFTTYLSLLQYSCSYYNTCSCSLQHSSAPPTNTYSCSHYNLILLPLQHSSCSFSYSCSHTTLLLLLQHSLLHTPLLTSAPTTTTLPTPAEPTISTSELHM